MAAQHLQFINIDEVINAYIDRSEQSNHKYFKLWHIANDGMRQLGLDFFYQVKSVKLPVLANKTVPLPDDYLNYSKVGVLNDYGEVIPLYYNSKFTTYADQLPDRQAKTEDNSLADFDFWNMPIFYNYWTNGGITNLFGVPSGQPFVGEFKIDTAAGLILLNERFCFDYLILEYVASPNPEPGGTYMLPMQFKEALIWYLAWQDQAFLPPSRKNTLGDQMNRRHNFWNERRLAIARYRPFHLEEAYEWNLRSQRLTIKG